MSDRKVVCISRNDIATDEELLNSMFEEISEVSVAVKRDVPAPTAEEMARAVREFAVAWKDFVELERSRSNAAIENRWWQLLTWLSITDSALKDMFCGRDRSPVSIAKYHAYRLKLVCGRPSKADA